MMQRNSANQGGSETLLVVGRGDQEQCVTPAVKERRRLEQVTAARPGDAWVAECGYRCLSGRVDRGKLTLFSRRSSLAQLRGHRSHRVTQARRGPRAASPVSTHETTSRMLAPLATAARSIGASSFLSALPENAASSAERLPPRCTEHNPAATRTSLPATSLPRKAATIVRRGPQRPRRGRRRGPDRAAFGSRASRAQGRSSRCCDDGAVPFENRWDRHTGGLARLGRPDDEQRLARLGGDQCAPTPTDDETTAARRAHAQQRKVSRRRHPASSSPAAWRRLRCVRPWGLVKHQAKD